MLDGMFQSLVLRRYDDHCWFQYEDYEYWNFERARSNSIAFLNTL